MLFYFLALVSIQVRDVWRLVREMFINSGENFREEVLKEFYN